MEMANAIYGSQLMQNLYHNMVKIKNCIYHRQILFCLKCTNKSSRNLAVTFSHQFVNL